MSQISYGTITITDTNDIESFYVEYAQSNSPTNVPGESAWTISRPEWIDGLYIWQRTKVHKSGTSASEDLPGTAVCITGASGAAGRSLVSTVTTYAHVAQGSSENDVKALPETRWVSNIPEYSSDYPDYWMRVVNTYENPTYTDTIYIKDNGITTAVAKANSADQKATAAVGTANEANNTANNALNRVQAKYGTSSSSSTATEKKVSCDYFVLFEGAEFFVKFTNKNNITNPTLNINNTGAKPIKDADGNDLAEHFYWKDGSLVHFVYDGSNWRILDIVTADKYNSIISNLEGISQTVGRKAEQVDLSNLTTRVSTAETNITQTADSIISLVSNNDTYTAPDGTVQTNKIKSAIKQNADNIDLRVEKNGVIAAINASVEQDGGSAVKIAANKVNIEGATIFTNGRLSESELNNTYDAKGAASTALQNANSYTDNKTANMATTIDINKLKATYGTCNTLASTQIKEVVCSNFELVGGNEITVHFTTANSYAAGVLQLKINNKTAKNVWVAGAVTSTTNQLIWGAGAYITFKYDGVQFITIGEPRSWYGASNTAASTAEKTDTTGIPGCVICKGAKIELVMTNKNSNDSATLNIQSTGAKPIYYGNTTKRPTESNGHSWIDGTAATLTFDGANYRMSGKTMIDGDNILTGTIKANRLDISDVNASNSLTIGALNSTTQDSILNNRYITDIDSKNGIQIHAIGNINSNYVKLNTSGLYIYKNNTQVGRFGSTTAIGDVTDAYVWIGSGVNSQGNSYTGMEIVRVDDATTDPVTKTSLAWFGATARIGAERSSHFNINSSSLQAFDSSNTKYFEVSASGIYYGPASTKVASEGYAKGQADDARLYADNYMKFSSSYGLKIAQSSPGTATTNYIQIASGGMKTALDANNYTVVTSSGFDVWKGGSSVALFGENVRIGVASSAHIELGATNGMNVFDKNNKLRLNASSTGINIFDYDSNDNRVNIGQFTGDTFRVGAASKDGHVRITSDGFNVCDAGYTHSYVRINSSQARFGLTNGTYFNINNSNGTAGLYTYLDANSGASGTLPRTQTLGLFNSDGLYLYNRDNGSLKAYFGSYVQLGSTNDASYATMTANGLTVNTKTTDDTSAKSSVFLGLDDDTPYFRIGRTDTDGVMTITPSYGLRIYNAGMTKTYARISAGQIRIGATDSNYLIASGSTVSAYNSNGDTTAVFGATSRVGLANDGHVNISSSGVEVIRKLSTDTNPVSMGWFGDTIRVGASNSDGHIRIDASNGVRFLRSDDSTKMAQLASDGLQIWQNDGTNNTSVAFFGALTRIGDYHSKNIYLTSSGVYFRSWDSTNNTSTYDGYITGTSARIGATTMDGNIYIDTTNGLSVYNAGQTASYLRLNSSGIRVGIASESHVEITSGGMGVFKKESGDSSPVSVAFFGSTVRVGQSGASRVVTDSAGIKAYNNLNDTVLNLGQSSSSMSYYRTILNRSMSSGASITVTLPQLADDTEINISCSTGTAIVGDGFYTGTSDSGTVGDITYTYNGTTTLTLKATSACYVSVVYHITGYAPAWTLGYRFGAIGGFSTTIGLNCTANKVYSTAIGFEVEALGERSFAQGYKTTVKGLDSFVTGRFTEADGDCQTVIGRNNSINTTSAFIIGNGESPSSRSNALTVDWYGNLVAKNRITAGSNIVLPVNTSIGTYPTSGKWMPLIFGNASANIYIGSATSDSSTVATETIFMRAKTVPVSNGDYSLGTSSYRWSNVYANSYNGLYKITRMEVPIVEGASGTNVSSTQYPIPDASLGGTNFTLAGIIGVYAESPGIYVYNYHKYSNTQIEAGFRRTYQTTATYKVHFWLLWLRGTSA